MEDILRTDTILGVDLGWVSQLESIGYCWIDDADNNIDPIIAAKSLGANTVRLRVFVNPPDYGFWIKPDKEMKGHKIEGGLVMLGFCDKDSVVEMSKRAKNAGMKLMVDFHYSDHFADPAFQDMPKAWEHLDYTSLKEKLSEHTKAVLLALKENGIMPEYVQVGNEINNGILNPIGDFHEHPEEMVGLLNCGYDAVKEVFPESIVVAHVSAGQILEYVKGFFDVYFQYGGKTDMIGLSYYPAWFQERHKPDEFLHVLNEIYHLYGKNIILSEIGGKDTEEEETYCLLRDTLQLIDKVNEKALKGIIYWEPEANRDILPDRYPLGAANLVGKKKLQYTKALSAYKNYWEDN